MQWQRGWLVLVGLLLVGLILGLSLDSATLAGWHQSQAASPDVSMPSNGAARNPVAANVRKSGSASPPVDAATLVEQCSQDHREALGRHLQVLANRQDANSQLARALLAPSVLMQDGYDDSLSYAAKAYAEARRLDPEDPLLPWLEAMNCGRATAGCDPDGAIQRLAKREPDNAAVWLMAMDAAKKHGDIAALDRYLTRAAQAGHYDLHDGEIGFLAEASLVGVPVPSSCKTESYRRMLGLERPVIDADFTAVHAFSVQAMNTFPPFQGFSSVCRIKDGVLPVQSRLAACMTVLSHMADSDNLIAQSLGLSFLVQYTADQPEGVYWRERLRNLRWLTEESSKQLPHGSEFVHSLFADGEVPTLQALLAASGRWPAPPGWLPKDARDRALITTGRPPPT